MAWQEAITWTNADWNLPKKRQWNLDVDFLLQKKMDLKMSSP